MGKDWGLFWGYIVVCLLTSCGSVKDIAYLQW